MGSKAGSPSDPVGLGIDLSLETLIEWMLCVAKWAVTGSDLRLEWSECS